MRQLSPRRPRDRLGPYELVGRLGAGGMGEVWEAKLYGPGGFVKAVALKLLPSGRTSGDAYSQALRREARLGALLNHPNVVSTLALSEHEGGWMVALELVRGASTEELLRARGPLPPRAVVEVGLQAAAGLAHTHALRMEGVPAGLVHRDIKPGNLLVDRSGFVKVADLGISRLALEEGEPAGTPGYMAPEQAEGRSEARSDLFSLGVTLYVLATGRRPFGTGARALGAVRDVERTLASPAFLAPLEARVPGLGAVARRCLRFDPAERYTTARQLRDDLVIVHGRQTPGPTLLHVLAKARPDLVPETVTASPEVPTLALPVGNLHPPRDRFVGRAEELRDLTAWVEGGKRLVVLLGPGGVGKTRLAFEAARFAAQILPGGAWVVDLSEARTAQGICATVAAALDLELDRHRPVAQLGQDLATRGRALVLVDNLEQCVKHLSATVGRWVDAAPDATFLCTSRMALGLRGAETIHLDSLTPQDAEDLFVARSTRPVRPEEQPEIAPLCAALDGMPLAIELAAARVRLLGVAGVRARLSLSLLSGGSGELPARQQSMEASIDWTCGLLGAPARDALGRLAVFEGGFTLNAAECVATSDGEWVLEVLDELVGAGLLRVDTVTGRFAMLPLVRAYSLDRAEASVRANAELQHGAWFAQLGAPEALAALDARDGRGRRRALALEVDNLVSACQRAMKRSDPTTALATLRAAWAVLAIRGPLPLAADLAVGVVDMPGHSRPAQGEALSLAGGVLRLARPRLAKGYLERGLAIHRELGDPGRTATTLSLLAALAHRGGASDHALACLTEALAATREAGDRTAEASILANLGNIHQDRGRPDLARAHMEAGLAIHRASGDRRRTAIVLSNLGIFHRQQGHADLALGCLTEALAAHRELHDRRGEAMVLGSLGVLHGQQGRAPLAQAHLERALAIHRELGNRSQEGSVLRHLGTVHAEGGRDGLARQHLERALQIHLEVADRRGQGQAWFALGRLHVGQGRTAEAVAVLETAEATLRGNDDPVETARFLLLRAEIRARSGDQEGARVVYDEARARLGDRTVLSEEKAHVRSLLRRGASSSIAAPEDPGTPPSESA